MAHGEGFSFSMGVDQLGVRTAAPQDWCPNGSTVELGHTELTSTGGQSHGPPGRINDPCRR